MVEGNSPPVKKPNGSQNNPRNPNLSLALIRHNNTVIHAAGHLPCKHTTTRDPPRPHSLIRHTPNTMDSTAANREVLVSEVWKLKLQPTIMASCYFQTIWWIIKRKLYPVQNICTVGVKKSVFMMVLCLEQAIQQGGNTMLLAAHTSMLS